MRRIEPILRRVQSLPHLRTSAVRLSQLLGDYTATPADFEAVLVTDPALTANLLRIANSAAYGARREIGTVAHALFYLGTLRVTELAASVSLARVVPDTLPGYGLSAEAVWVHCSTVGALTEGLARVAGKRHGLAFTAGLLHDIGKLAVGASLAERQDDMLQGLAAEDRSLVELESELLGVHHGEVGAMVAERWDLPEALAAVCRWHHEPEACPDPEHQHLVDLVHVANVLAHSLGFGADVGGLARTLEPEALTRLGIERSDLEQVVAESLESVQQLHKLLREG